MINTKSIRDRILLLALKGELVEQKPQDVPASNLIDKLCKKFSDKSFEPDFSKDEVPYDVPSSWSWCRLSDIGSTNIGLTYHPEDVTENGVIVARSSNIVNGKMDYSDLVKVSCNIRENQYLNNNDILICARNGSKALVGKCAIYEGDSKTIAFGAFMAVFRTPLFRYVYYYFNTDVFKRNFISDDSKQINQVTQNILKQSLIPIPPLEEQERIVERIEAIFEILDKIDALQNQYVSNQEALKSKLIDAAIQGKLTEQLPEDGTAEELREEAIKYKEKLATEGILKNRKNKDIREITDEECLFELPYSWSWFRLGEVIEVFGRIGFRGYKKSDLVQEGQGAITMSPSNISKSGDVSFDNSTYISWEKYEESPEIMLEEGDVVLVKTGSTYGKCGIIDKLPEKATINPQLAILKYIKCNRKYLYYVLRSSAAWTQYESFVVGAATPTFSQEKLSNMMIPMPPMAEQERIVDMLDQVFEDR